MNTTRPPRRPTGSRMPLDELQLKRDPPATIDFDQSFKAGIKAFVERPVATIVSFASVIVVGVLTTYVVHYMTRGLSVVINARSSVPPDVTSALMAQVSLALVHLIMGLMFGSMVPIALRIVRRQPLTKKCVLDAVPFFPALLVAWIVGSLAIGFFSLFFTIPGILVALGIIFAAFAIVDKRVGPIESLRASWRLTRGYKWHLLLFCILHFMLNTLGILLFGVGTAVTAPFSMVSLAVLYDAIAEPGNAYLADGELQISERDGTFVQRESDFR